MQLVKLSKGVYDAKLTDKEKRALERIVKGLIAEHERKNLDEIDATVLMILHLEFGWGVDRLKRFHHAFIRRMDDFLKRYEVDEEDQDFIALEWCKQYGIDLKKWGEEYEQQSKNEPEKAG